MASEWRVDRVGSADVIGHPGRRLAEGEPRGNVDLERPAAFACLSTARFDDDILMQISYMVWLRERSKDGVLDLLGGWLDAVS